MSTNRPNPLEAQKFAESLIDLLRERDSRAPRGSVLVALSGGPDSVALLHLMHTAGKDMGFKVAAAHVNYGLRGKESRDDEQFCRELCRKLGIKLFVKKIKLSLKTTGTNLQAEARRIRYELFDSLCSRQGFDLIATGHNKTDSVESILMNLGRGAGTFGMTGIDPVSGRIIRPLLDFSREEILSYLKQNRLTYRIDRSNLESKYTRNKIRLLVLPLLEQVFGIKVTGSIIRTGAILRQQEQFVRAEISRILTRDATATAFGKIALDLRRFRRYDTFIKQLLIAGCFERLTGSLQNFELAATDRVIEMCAAKTGRVDLMSGVFSEIAGDRLYFYRKVSPLKPQPVKRSGSTSLPDYKSELTIEEVPSSMANPKRRRAGQNLSIFVDKDRVRGRLTVRSALPGDRFVPLGMTGSKKLSDFLVDRKVDRPLREEIPLLLCGNRIVWIIGHEIADDVKISKKTKTVLKLEVIQHRAI